MARLRSFETLLRDENEFQNLVSKPSLGRLWARHIADSAQLLLHAPNPQSKWLDLGSGAGFPGLVVAVLHPGPVTLIEERRLRSDFLRRAADMLGVAERVEIVAGRAERAAAAPNDVISARAFAPLPRLFELGTRFSTPNTRWILPKGRSAQSELDAALGSWQGDFRLEPSMTDPEARIVVAERVKRKR
ncbi:16S rRNA (guanine(527)-N(7))-methyltransferase RsmG [Allosphingosinicella sp.]|uniref:16S rRNA (guanine(527)-N(7))-methyltransferase RsmG n=1 Tax=Allosphingosinicella sp. TaxID=2823234 RepID=UPI002F0CADE5